jgi:hypothetical protein
VTSAELGAFASLIAASGLVIFLILVGVPAVARLLFRYRLETVRDDCVDAVLDGQLPSDPSVKAFVGSVDRLATRARDLTLPRAVAMYITFLRFGVPENALPEPACYRELEPAQHKLMDEFERRRGAALWSYLTWGSLMGWVLAPALVAIAHRVSPVGRFVKPADALPKLTRDAVLCSDQSSSPLAVEWVSRRLFAHRYDHDPVARTRA